MLLLVADGHGAETAVGTGVGWTATAALVLAAAGAAVAGVRLVERETLVEGAPALAPVEPGAGPPASAPPQATTAAGSTALGREPVVAPAPLDPFWEAVRAARRGAPRLRLEERLAPEDAALLEALRTHDLAGYHAPAEPWADRVRDLARRSGLPLEVDPASQDVDGTAPDLALLHPIAVGDLLELAAASSRRLRWALRDGAVVVGREGRVRGPLIVAGPSIADLRIDPDDFHVTGDARKDLFPRISPEDVLQLVREASDAAAWDREDALLAWGGSVDDLLRDVPGDLGVALDARGLAAGEVFVACNEAPALAPIEETLDALRAFWLPDPEASAPGVARPWLAAAPASPRYREHLERLAAIRFELPPTTRTLGAAAGELARAAALDVWVAPELRGRPVAPDPTTRSASEWLRAWTEPDGLAWDAAHGLVRVLPDPGAARGVLLGLFDLRDLLDGAGRIADLDVGPALDPAEWPPEDVLTGDVLDAWLRDTLAPASWEANPACRLRVIDAAGVLVLWQLPEAQAEAARRFDAIRERRAARR